LTCSFKTWIFSCEISVLARSLLISCILSIIRCSVFKDQCLPRDHRVVLSATTFIIYHILFRYATYFFKFFSRSSFLLHPVSYSRNGRNKNIPRNAKRMQHVKHSSRNLSHITFF